MKPSSGDPTVRLLALHDADGRIASLAVSPMDGPLSRPRDGQARTEVDVSGLNLPAGGSEIGERLLEMVQHYRVEQDSSPNAKARLIPRKA